MLHSRYTSIAEEPENEASTSDSQEPDNGSAKEQKLYAARNGTRNAKRRLKSESRSDPSRALARSARLSTLGSNEDTMDESGSDLVYLTDEDDEAFTEDDENSNFTESVKNETRPGIKPKQESRTKSTAGDSDEVLKDENLSASQIREIKEAFHVFDVNGDGCITATELKKLVTSLGYNITEAELMDMMNQIDSDGNGAIDFPEFLSLMTKNLDDSDPEDILLESFKVFDRDNSRFIGVSELDRVFKLLGQDFKDYEIEAMIKAADADGDGLVSYDDFVKMMKV